MKLKQKTNLAYGGSKALYAPSSSPASLILRNIGRQGLLSIKSKEKFSHVWKYKPVSTRKFFSSFFKEALFPEQQRLADKILGRRPTSWTSMDKYGIPYTVANCVWGKGSGKDRTSAKILTYVAYKLCCMRNPHITLGGVGESSDIDLVNVSINSRLAKDVFFGYLKYIVKNTIDPETGENWFETHGGLKILSRDIEFGNNIHAYSCDSTEYTGEGLNIAVVIFDEVGGFKVSLAKALDDALAETAKSRFPTMYKVIRISYIRDVNDYMMTSYKKGKKTAGVFNTKKATWEVNILRKKSDFEDEFRKNPERANRVFGSVVSVGEAGFFRYRDPIYKIFRPEHTNPFVGDVISTIDIKSLRIKKGYQFDNRAPFFAHFDGGTGKEGCDCAGFSLVHPINNMPVRRSEKFIKILAKKGFEVSPKMFGLGFYIDIALQIHAPAGGEVIFSDIYYFMKALISNYKLKLRMFTMDGWQSRSDIQQLNARGIESKVLSVDKTKGPYETVKGKVYEGLIDSYDNIILSRELRELQLVESSKVDKRRVKINHPDTSSERLEIENDERGSKDVSDAVAGAIYDASEYVSQFGCGYAYEQHQQLMTYDHSGIISPAEFAEQYKGIDRALINKQRKEAQEKAKLVHYGEVPTNVWGIGI